MTGEANNNKGTTRGKQLNTTYSQDLDLSTCIICMHACMSESRKGAIWKRKETKERGDEGWGDRGREEILEVAKNPRQDKPNTME